jgi:4-hydroxybenzoate polyprenyltransferase
MVLFALGAVVMRGAGCTLNDIVDRDIDARVARTADRPIPSGAVSVRQAALFFAIQCMVGLFVLVQLNALAIAVGIASLSLVAVYPFMKRITYWPQVVLGLAFNWGVLVGWSAVRGTLGAAPVLLYLGGIFWTLAYDTIYAHQDKNDDIRVGVKSTALRLGAATRPWLFVFHGLALTMIAAAVLCADARSWLFVAALALAGAHATWQAGTVDLDDPADCLRKFKANRDLGVIVLAGLVLARVGA